MNKSRFGQIAFENHTFASPLSSDKLNRFLQLLELQPNQRVLDVGCGNAEILIRLAESYGITGVGIDSNKFDIEGGRERAAFRGVASNLTLHAYGIADHPEAEPLFDAALCIGASHAYGTYQKTLSELTKRVKPGGQILVGEGFWKKTPDPAYLELLGAEPDEMNDHAGNARAGQAEGLTYLCSSVTNEDEWDEFEGLYNHAIERFADANSHDEDAPAFRDYIRNWHNGYLNHGRDTLGFALYLFQKPFSR